MLQNYTKIYIALLYVLAHYFSYFSLKLLKAEDSDSSGK